MVSILPGDDVDAIRFNRRTPSLSSDPEARHPQPDPPWPTMAFAGAHAARASRRASAQGSPGAVVNDTSHPGEGPFRAEIMDHRAAVVLAKATFGPRWRVTDDGVGLKPGMVAPDLVGREVSAGSHTVEFRNVPFHGYLVLLPASARPARDRDPPALADSPATGPTSERDPCLGCDRSDECGRDTAMASQRKSLMSEFKDFVLRGNVIDLAVAVVIGAAFGTVVTALVKDILTPIVAAIFGQPDFSALVFGLNHSVFRYGEFINAVITFLSVAAVVFFVVVKPINVLTERRKRVPEPESSNRPCPECLSAIPKLASRCAYCTSAIPPLE